VLTCDVMIVDNPEESNVDNENRVGAALSFFSLVFLELGLEVDYQLPPRGLGIF
jgi:hypothetical protein